MSNIMLVRHCYNEKWVKLYMKFVSELCEIDVELCVFNDKAYLYVKLWFLSLQRIWFYNAV